MESNISRDHIALEAMKIIYSKMSFGRLTPVDRLRKLLGLPVPNQGYTSWTYESIAKEAYSLADAMIAEREKTEGQG